MKNELDPEIVRKFRSEKVCIADEVKDHGDDPFFKEKDERMKRTLDKYGFPKEIYEQYKGKSPE